MSRFFCEPLSKHHDRKGLDCGVPDLNKYLTDYASQDIKRNVASVYVMVEASNPNCVIGFYTLCATSVELSSLPEDLTKKLPRYPEIPAFLIGRLARDVRFPGVGSLLLSDALNRCIRIASEIAASLIVVDSKGEAATSFYNKYGFLSLPNLPDRMFLSIKTVEIG